MTGTRERREQVSLNEENDTLTSSHSSDLPLVAGLNEKSNVGVHEGDGHGDFGSIGEDVLLVHSSLLDVGEDLWNEERSKRSEKFRSR